MDAAQRRTHRHLLVFLGRSGYRVNKVYAAGCVEFLQGLPASFGAKARRIDAKRLPEKAALFPGSMV
jgi:hypothetical protein